MMPPWVWVALASAAATVVLAVVLGSLARFVAGVRGWRGLLAFGAVAALLVANSYTLPMLRQVDRFDLGRVKIERDSPRCYPPFETDEMNAACGLIQVNGQASPLRLAHEAWFAELSARAGTWAQVGTWSLAGVAILAGAAYLAYQVWSTHHTTALLDRVAWAVAGAGKRRPHPPSLPPYLQ